VRDLGSLLDDIGLGDCWELLKRHDIDNEVLRDLTDQDLERMGFTLGQRLKLRRAIATLPETAADLDARPATAQRAERRQLTVMFCDLVGSTELAVRLDPEDWRDVLSNFLDVTTTAIARFHGYVARYMGDGFLVYFGWPHGHEDAAEQAVRAGVAVVDAVRRLNNQPTQLQVRVGIATGLVVVGQALGAGASREHNAAGATTNLAARLQSAAAPNRIVIAESTRRLLGNSFKLEPIGPFDLKGFGTSVPAWHVLRERDTDSRFRALRSGMPGGIVGRSEQVALLGNRWRASVSGAGQVVLLSGDPGIGKTHIVEAFADGLASVPHLRLRFQCLSHYSSTALHPVIHAVKRAARFAPADAVATRVHKLHRMLRGLGLETNEATDVFASILSFQTAAPAPRGIDPKQRKQRTLGLLVDYVASLAARGPVLLQFEDMQWSDPTTLELCDIIVERAATLPLMLIATARPEFSPAWPDAAHITRHQVVGLGPDESEEMIRRVAGGKSIPPRISKQILGKTDGIPLYIEELTKELLESGALTEDDEGWTLGSDIATLSVPATLQDSLTARLDRLGWVKAIAQTAAVVGRDFSLELLVPLIGLPPERIVAGLQSMVDAQIATALGSYPSVTYNFRHALIQDAAYSGLLLRERRALHELCAQKLEANFPEMAASHPEMLAHHYAAATLDFKAALWWLRAGLQSLQRSAMTEALTQLRHALSLLATVPEDADRWQTELEVLVVYGKALTATQGHAALSIGEVFDRARSLCDRLEDPLQLLTVLFIQWNHSFFRGRFAEARQRASDLLARATRRSEPTWTVMGYYTLGFTTLVTGDIATAISLLRQGIALFNPEDRHLYAGPTIGDPRIIMRTYLSWGLMMQGAFSEAERELADAVQEARQLSQPWGLALVLAMRVLLLLPLRGPAVAEQNLDELSRVAAGFEHYSAISVMQRGWVLAALGDLSAGLVLAREGLKRRVATGTRLHVPNFLRVEASILLRMNRTAEALAVLEAAKKMQIETGEHCDDCEFHRERGETLIADGQVAAGEAELVAAMHVAAERGQCLFELRASVSLARLLVRRGEHAAAEHILRKARALVEDVPELLDVAAADELLARLVETAR
jgi:class 3 adenylate cyclase/tetratricopeptide (TPR) repeat protein